jgi:hypothetical protein
MLPRLHNDRLFLFSPTIDYYKFQSNIDQNKNLKMKVKTDQGIDKAVNNLNILIHSAVFLSNIISVPQSLTHKNLFLFEQICSLVVQHHQTWLSSQIIYKALLKSVWLNGFQLWG